MPEKPDQIEIELSIDDSKISEFLNIISPIVPKNTNIEELYWIFRHGFKFHNQVASRTDNSQTFICEPLDWLLELYPAIRAGELSFGALKDFINIKLRIGNKTDHN